MEQVRELRFGRRETPRGGHGFDIHLHSTNNTSAVYWTASCNSYIAHKGEIYSINGIGEIRWKVERWNPEYAETLDYFYVGAA